MEKKSTGKTVIIVILILMLLAACAYIAYDKLYAKSDIVQEKESSVVAPKSIKLDDSKDYVYNPGYTFENQYSEYKVPFININSYDAGLANGTLKGVYYAYVINIYSSRNEPIPGTLQMDYTSYINDNIVSVVTKCILEYTDLGDPHYYIYNFNLKTGKNMSYSEVLKELNLSEEETKEKIESKIRENKTEQSEGMNDLEYTEKNIEDGIKDFENTKDEERLFYIQDETLKVITTIHRDVGRGAFLETISLD